MVEFCTACGTSLPKGDLTIKGGRLYTSPDYTCPSCNGTANPAKDADVEPPAPGPEQDLVFRRGEAGTE
jgi:hypothetical protein